MTNKKKKKEKSKDKAEPQEKTFEEALEDIFKDLPDKAQTDIPSQIAEGMVKIVGIRFKGTNKIYYFSHDGQDFKRGDMVIVETSRGMEYAYVAIPCKEVEESSLVSPLKPILRLANDADRAAIAANEKKKPEAAKAFNERVKKYNLPMKYIDCEFSLDGSKLIYYFTAESRVDFREFVRDLSAVFHLRTELRQIGIREEIKMLGGLAPCGRECCCVSGATDVDRVTIKMAKSQGLSLNPTKISGLCGRLMCCLSYENYYYAEAYKQMPKVGIEVTTPEGKGIVSNIDMLKMRVKVRLEEGDSVKYTDFDLGDIEGYKRLVPEDTEEEEEEKEKELEIAEEDEVFIQDYLEEETLPKKKQKGKKPAKEYVKAPYKKVKKPKEKPEEKPDEKPKEKPKEELTKTAKNEAIKEERKGKEEPFQKDPGKGAFVRAGKDEKKPGQKNFKKPQTPSQNASQNAFQNTSQNAFQNASQNPSQNSFQSPPQNPPRKPFKKGKVYGKSHGLPSKNASLKPGNGHKGKNEAQGGKTPSNNDSTGN